MNKRETVYLSSVKGINVGDDLASPAGRFKVLEINEENISVLVERIPKVLDPMPVTLPKYIEMTKNPTLDDRFLAQLWAMRHGVIHLTDDLAITLFAAYNKLRDARTAKLYNRLERWGA